jgi:riboflavin biosynthesis pyrimidine reductase
VQTALEGHLALGGATLAATLKLGLIDACRIFVRPIIPGGARPCFPALDRPSGVQLDALLDSVA